ncbi:MAG: DUF4157 domain-containing protein, partial [Caldilineaceae bacterium]
MTRSLSPWVREMLNEETAPTAGGSLVQRVMRRRTDESMSFLSTLAILRRFHRIVTRASAWKAGVGTISPNLFEKFSDEMFKSWDIGANNITALLKINRQEEALDMPLAGEVGGPAAKQAQPAANAMPAMTLEEIRRRVAEARQFESLSPSAVPNFVKGQAGPPEVRPVAQHPGNRPTPAPRRPTDQPSARPLPGQTPPSQPAPPAQSAAQQSPMPAPRMRRRMARSVEYLSVPDSDGEAGEGDGSDDGESAPPFLLDKGPPGLDWFFPEAEGSGQDWVSLAAPDTSISRPSLPVTAHRQQQTAHASRMRPQRPRLISSAPPANRSQSAGRKIGRGPGMIQRALERLTQSATGRLLASRPQLLLDHIQQRAAQPARQAQQGNTQQDNAQQNEGRQTGAAEPGLADLLAPASGQNDDLRQTSPRQSVSPLLPVGLDDFALPYPLRLLQRRADPSLDAPDALPPGQSAGTAAATRGQTAPTPTRSTPAPRQTATALLTTPAPDRARPPMRPAPVARLAHTLAALQVRPLRRSPTVMRFAVSPTRPPERSAPIDTRPETDSRPNDPIGQNQIGQNDEWATPDALPVQALRSTFEPVSDLWRSALMRSLPDRPQPDISLPAAPGLAGNEPLLPPLTPQARGAAGASGSIRVARSALVPVELALAHFRRTTRTPSDGDRTETAAPDTSGQPRVVRPTPPRQRATPTRREQSARLAAPRSVEPPPILVERLVRRDFAGTRGDLLAGGLLSLPQSMPASNRSERVSPRSLTPVRARPDYSQTKPRPPQMTAGSASARGEDFPLRAELTPSAQVQTRQLLRRSISIDEGRPAPLASALRTRRGLRPTQTRSQSLRSPLPARPGEVDTRGSGVGESSLLAQRIVNAHPALEPVSRLWRVALLPTAAAEGLTGLALPGAVDRIYADAQDTPQDIPQAARIASRVSPSFQDQPAAAALPLASARLIPRQPQVAVLDDSGMGEGLVERSSSPQPRRPSSQTLRGQTSTSGLSTQAAGFVDRSSATTTLLERVAQRIYPQAQAEPSAARPATLPARRLPVLIDRPAQMQAERPAVSGLPLPTTPGEEQAQTGDRQPPRLQRRYQPGATGQAASQWGKQRRRARVFAPVSSAWSAQPETTPSIFRAVNAPDLSVGLLPQMESVVLRSASGQALLPDLPLRRMAGNRPAAAQPELGMAASAPLAFARSSSMSATAAQPEIPESGRTQSARPASATVPGRPLPGQTRGERLTSTLVDLTRQPVYRGGLPRSRPSGRGHSPRVWAADREISRNLNRAAAVAVPSAPVRPLGQQILARDFAHTRRDQLLDWPVFGSQPAVARETRTDSPPRPLVLATGRTGVGPYTPPPADAPGPFAGGDADGGLAPGAMGRGAARQANRQRVQRQIEPVSDLWRSSLLQDELPAAVPSGRDVAGPVSLDGAALLGGDLLQRGGDPVQTRSGVVVPAGQATFASLELAIDRLVRRRPDSESGLQPGTPPVAGRLPRALPGREGSAAQAVERLEAGGWRFKRSRVASSASAPRVQRALAALHTGGGQRLPTRPRTLMERILQRDFAGVRVQMASLGPLGIEAAAQSNTVYLNRAQARLDSPESLALLGHELTHLAAGGSAPLLPPVLQSSTSGPASSPPSAVSQDLPLATPLRPSLSRRLSRDLVQMSLADEEYLAEDVERAVRRT